MNILKPFKYEIIRIKQWIINKLTKDIDLEVGSLKILKPNTIRTNSIAPLSGNIISITGYFSGDIEGDNSDNWIKFPNNLLIQWGYQDIAVDGNTITLPQSYLNTNFYVLVTNADRQGTAVDNAFGYPTAVNQIYVSCKRSDLDAESNFPVYWMTIDYV